MAVGAAVSAVFIVFRPAQPPQENLQKVAGESYLVITRPVFQEALQPWIDFREAQGFQVDVKAWEAAPSAEDLQNWVRTHEGNSKYLLLVGDCAGPADELPEWHVPSRLLEKGAVSDTLYGDVDADQSPDIAVGRLPVRTPADLERLVAKILDNEKRPTAEDPYEALIWVTVSGFEDLAARVAARVRELAPDWLSPVVIADSADPGRQPARFLDALANPLALAVVVAHASYRDIMVSQRRKEVNLSVEHIARLHGAHAAAPLFILACDTGKFHIDSAKGLSLSEAFLFHPAGPIAVAASSTSSSLILNYAFAKTLALELREKKNRNTAGTLLLSIQRRLLSDKQSLASGAPQEDPIAARIQEIAEKHPANPSTPKTLREEILSYNLLGDPASPLRLP